MIGSPEQDSGRVGKARESLRQFAPETLEALPLRPAFGVFWLIGASEMAHHQSELEDAPEIVRPCEALDLRRGKAEPVHAAVDVDSGREPRARRHAERSPLPDLLGAVEDRPQAMLAVEGRGPFEQSIEDIDRRQGQEGAQALGFAKRGDEEGLAAGVCEGGRDIGHAQSIGIGLDHGRAFGRGAELGQAAVIGGNGTEIDGEDRWRRRRIGFRFARPLAAEGGRAAVTPAAPEGDPPWRDC